MQIILPKKCVHLSETSQNEISVDKSTNKCFRGSSDRRKIESTAYNTAQNFCYDFNIFKS